jgi:drug/metabolite transporter (DMT)-like permease
MYKAQLHWQPIALLLIITMIWGSNMAAVKIASREMAPIFMAGFRSVVASLCLYIWMRARRIKVFPSAVVLGHGIVAGILFGSEFGLIFVGLEYTLASRGYVLLYVVVAFLSYLVWFVLVSRYPVSLMHAFSFFTPVFGVLFSGMLILGETISPNLVMALALVSIGMVLVNYQPKRS